MHGAPASDQPGRELLYVKLPEEDEHGADYALYIWLDQTYGIDVDKLLPPQTHIHATVSRAELANNRDLTGMEVSIGASRLVINADMTINAIIPQQGPLELSGGTSDRCGFDTHWIWGDTKDLKLVYRCPWLR